MKKKTKIGVEALLDCFIFFTILFITEFGLYKLYSSTFWRVLTMPVFALQLWWYFEAFMKEKKCIK